MLRSSSPPKKAIAASPRARPLESARPHGVTVHLASPRAHKPRERADPTAKVSLLREGKVGSSGRSREEGSPPAKQPNEKSRLLKRAEEAEEALHASQRRVGSRHLCCQLLCSATLAPLAPSCFFLGGLYLHHDHSRQCTSKEISVSIAIPVTFLVIPHRMLTHHHHSHSPCNDRHELCALHISSC